MPAENDEHAGDPVEVPIDGTLDLHTFRPQEVKDIVTAYLEACRAKGILEVRVVHGKGIGQLRQTVQSVLARLPYVASFAIATERFGGTGATFVHLKPPEDAAPEA
jgi:DNA-nicking Smr family endonuclease